MPTIIKSTKKKILGGKKKPASEHRPTNDPIDPACRKAIAAFIDRAKY